MKKATILISLIFSLNVNTHAQIVTPYSNQILYVDSAATGNGDGTSWGNAVNSLSDALRYARLNASTWDNDSLRIFVAKGTYFPQYNAADSNFVSNGNRNNAFVMVKNVQLVGGFPSGGGSRDWELHPTVLDGNIGSLSDSSDNCYHVVISSGYMNRASLDGFTLINGSSIANNSPYYINVNGNNISKNNGGGIIVYNSAPILLNVVLRRNSAINGGGGSIIKSTSKISNFKIDNNFSIKGGGIYIDSSTTEITNTIISSNKSLIGGGLHILDIASLNLTNMKIVNNSVTHEGGGIYNSSNLPVILTNVLIAENTANEGGGIYNYFSSQLTINNSTISRNNTGISSVLSTNCKIFNSIIYANSSYPYPNTGYNTNVININSLTDSLTIFKNSYLGGGTWNMNWGINYENNIVSTANPFVDYFNGNYQLKDCSSAINSGNNSLYQGNMNADTDVEGNNRLHLSSIDMGASEYQGNYFNTYSTIIDTVCSSYTSPSGQFFTMDGIYNDIIANSEGCDSVIKIYLTINSNINVSMNSTSITSYATNANYQWLDCNNNYAALIGDTFQMYTPSQNGSYAVEVSQNGCVDTSACYIISHLGIMDQQIAKEFSVFPNPTNGELTIKTNEMLEEFTITIRDVTGKIVSSTSYANTNTLETKLNVQPGIYLVEINSPDLKSQIKVVKE